ncbi:MULTISPECIES: hypothetical protein [Microcoleaceae]|uniref:hypothetical protein n=1 Tax=Microcoleaceae TaxID=1892252 RepID=UPI001882FD60|nr:hypothetical protein [Tychonema sp. LEGE 06208]
MDILRILIGRIKGKQGIGRSEAEGLGEREAEGLGIGNWASAKRRDWASAKRRDWANRASCPKSEVEGWAMGIPHHA